MSQPSFAGSGVDGIGRLVHVGGVGWPLMGCIGSVGWLPYVGRAGLGRGDTAETSPNENSSYSIRKEFSSSASTVYTTSAELLFNKRRENSYIPMPYHFLAHLYFGF